MREDDISETLNDGGVGVLPTDTLYGLVGSALIPETVERIYELKRRSFHKPLIVLVADIEDTEQFGAVLSEKLIGAASGESSGSWRGLSSRGLLDRYWPGPYSIIIPIVDDSFEYLSRGTDAIAFRLPNNEELRELLRKTGPLVAPSANVEGRPIARTVAEARKYFGDDIDFYIDGGELSAKPSTILKWDGCGFTIVRE